MRLPKRYTPNKEDEDIKTERIIIRVTAREKVLIEKMARCQYLTISSFIRWAILHKYREDFIQYTE